MEFRLSNGEIVTIPSDLSRQETAQLLMHLESQIQHGETNEQYQDDLLGSGDSYSFIENYTSPASGTTEGIPSVDTGPEGTPEVDGGTLAGSAWEAVKSIPRGVRQTGIMALMGIEGMRTPDEDTQREKNLRGDLQNLMMEIDPKYRDAHLPQLGMALGQVAGLMGTSLIPGVGKPLAMGSGALMMAGDAARRVAEYEEATGEDVSKSKEQLAMLAGLGLGMTEVAPFGKYARMMGMRGKLASGFAETAADQVGQMTSNQFRGHLLRSAGTQFVKEGLQEGLSEYALSATGRYLYDKDGLVNEGSEAFREALIGGEAGAITDALMNMVQRGAGVRALRTGNFRANQELERRLADLRQNGVFEDKNIENFITGGDVEAVRARLAEPDLETGEILTEEQIEAHPDLKTARDIRSVHEAILDPEGGALEVSRAQAKEEQAAVNEAFENGTIDERDRDRLRGEIRARTHNFEKTIGTVRAALQGTEAASDGLVDEKPNLDGPQTEEEVQAEIGRLQQERQTLQEQLNEDPENVQVTQGLQLIDQSIAANEARRESLKVQPRREPVVEDMAPEQEYSGADVLTEIAKDLRPTVDEIETAEEVKLSGDQGRLGAIIAQNKETIKKRQAQVDKLNQPEKTDNQRRTTEQNKAAKELKREQAELESLSRSPEELQEESQQLMYEVSQELEAGDITQDQADTDPRIEQAIALADQATARQAQIDAELEAGAEVSSVEENKKRLEEVRDELAALQPDALLASTRQEIADLERTIKNQEGGRPTYEEVLQEDGRGGTNPVMRLASGLTPSTRPNFLKRLKRDARKKLDTDKTPLRDLVGRFVTAKQRNALMSLLFNPADPETWPVGYETWHVKQKGEKKLSPIHAETLARNNGYEGWVFNPELASEAFPDGMLVPVPRPDLKAPKFPTIEDRQLRYDSSESLRREKESDKAYQERKQRATKAISNWQNYRNEQLSLYDPTPFAERALSGVQVRSLLDDLYSDGLRVRVVSAGIGRDTRYEVLIADPDAETTTPAQARTDASPREEKAVGQARANRAYDEILGWWNSLSLAEYFEKKGKDRPLPSKLRKKPQMQALYASLGILSDTKEVALLRELKKNNFDITIDVIKQALEIKNYAVPAKATSLISSKFLKGLMAATGAGRTDWQQLSRGEKEAVLSRILRSEAQPDTTPEGQAEKVERKVIQQKQDAPEALPKGNAEKALDRNNLVIAKNRIQKFVRIAQKQLRRLGYNDVAIAFEGSAGNIYEDVEDIIINGAFEIERNPDGSPVLENGEPVLVKDDDGNAVLRQRYNNNTVASLDNFGTRIVFNLAQVLAEADLSNMTAEQVIKNAAVHEGTHALFVRNDLTGQERRGLEQYGRKQRVPEQVNKKAHDEGLTWRQYVEKSYSDLTEAELTEETSVQILDALAQDKIPQAKAAGIIAKIKRRIVSTFNAIFNASQSGDIFPVLRVFEDIKKGEIVRRRQARAEAEGFTGASALRLAERADPKDLERLNAALAEGDRAKIDQIADEILLSKTEFADTRTDEERLLDSFVAEIRARDEIADTPTSVVKPVLNRDAIESGEVTPESLDAAFRFIDGRQPPFRMPVGPKELRSLRWGGQKTHADSPTLATVLEGVPISKENKDPGSQVTDAAAKHNRIPDGQGGWAYVENDEDFRRLIGDYAFKENFRQRLLDRRLPIFLAEQRAGKKHFTKYGEALVMLAENSALAAWRFADNALNFLPGIMKFGMLSYVGGGFSMDQLYAKNPDGSDVLDADGNKIKVKSLFEIFAPLAESEQTQKVALSYLAVLRIRGVEQKVADARQRLSEAEAVGVDSQTLQQLENEVLTFEDLLARTNPRTDKQQFFSDKKMREIESQMANPSPDAEQQVKQVQQFVEDYQRFNHHVIEFAHQTGEISKESAVLMQSMPYVPFYRDKGWENSTVFQHQNSEESRKQTELAEDGDDARLRGAPRIDKSIEGSFEPIREDLFGIIIENVNALVRDGMANVAIARTVRDQVANGTGREIPQVSEQDERRQKLLKKEIKRRTKELGKDHPSVLRLQAEKDALDQKIKEIIAAAKAINKELDDLGFAPIYIEVKGVAKPLEPTIDFEAVRRRLAQESGKAVTEITGAQVQEELANNGARTEEYIAGQTEADFESPTDMLNGGETKTYRVTDPQLVQSVMTIGFSPLQSIENFFTDRVKLPPKVSAGIAKILVGSSRVLREAVTKSPPFMIKNIIRDAMQATVVYGGGPPMFFKIVGSAISGMMGSDLVQRAEMAGLGIGVDWSPDPKTAGTDIKRMLKREQMKWSSPTDWGSLLWNGLGHMTKVSEVATRMAVYDHAKASGLDNAGALNQAIEIINYGRRGSSPLWSVIMAMAPFMNGRIQGLDVTYRTHMGSMDVPGLFEGAGGGLGGLISEEQRMQNSRKFRVATMLGRGALLSSGTLLYYMMVRDEEEYKNAREDLKDDWWLIPLGKGKPGIKIPIPFEVGTMYKVIPEQLARAFFEKEHDLGDMRDAVRRQITASLYFDLRPQVVRPLLDAARNKDSYQRDEIVPSWMEETVAATEQFNPYTNMVTRIMGDSLGNVPFLNNPQLDFLTSPMKLEYMLRQYFGTLGSYVMAAADAGTRNIMKENVVGTQADFVGTNLDTFIQIPGIRDLIFDPRKGGGYQEDFYELVEDMDKLVTTMGQIRESRGYRESLDYKERYEPEFQQERRVRYFERRMKYWRERRDALFERRDLSNEEKRRVLHRMFEQRDQMLEEMNDIMGEIREDRGIVEQLFGGRP